MTRTIEFPRALTGVTVILPVINETASLTATVETIIADCGALIDTLLIVVADRTTTESFATVTELQRRQESRFLIIRQRRPFLGGALRDGLEHVATSHVVIMSSDFETDPRAVKALVKTAQAYPAMIIAASRWLNGAVAPPSYGGAKRVCNRIFQKLFSTLYRVRLSDMSHGFRIYPTALMRAIAWEELQHAFLFETLVKPLRLGVPVIEIPAAWHTRIGGVSQNRLLNYLAYFRVGISVRFRACSALLLPRSRQDTADPAYVTPN
jgi:glycosyltransferase involved in cell wall biosynthesis